MPQIWLILQVFCLPAHACKVTLSWQLLKISVAESQPCCWPSSDDLERVVEEACWLPCLKRGLVVLANPTRNVTEHTINWIFSYMERKVRGWLMVILLPAGYVWMNSVASRCCNSLSKVLLLSTKDFSKQHSKNVWMSSHSALFLRTATVPQISPWWFLQLCGEQKLAEVFHPHQFPNCSHVCTGFLLCVFLGWEHMTSTVCRCCPRKMGYFSTSHLQSFASWVQHLQAVAKGYYYFLYCCRV